MLEEPVTDGGPPEIPVNDEVWELCQRGAGYQPAAADLRTGSRNSGSRCPVSGLSRSLVDAAAAADWQAHNAAVLKVVGKRVSLEEKRRAISRARSRAAVAAVLETLADGRMVMSDEFLRRLAAEVIGRIHGQWQAVAVGAMSGLSAVYRAQAEHQQRLEKAVMRLAMMTSHLDDRAPVLAEVARRAELMGDVAANESVGDDVMHGRWPRG